MFREMGVRPMFRKRIYTVVLAIGLGVVGIGSIGHAQNQSRAQGPSVRSQVAKILLSSLGGAVLGISTLSFYDRPQDHLSNVAVGGTVGALLGSIYVTKESLDYETVSTLEEGGTWTMAMLPRREELQLSWRFSF